MSDAPVVWKVQAVRSRKEHRCTECGRVIEQGELHEYVWGVWDGDPNHIRTCAECTEVRDDLREDLLSAGGLYIEEVYEEIAYGNLQNALAENITALAGSK